MTRIQSILYVGHSINSPFTPAIIANLGHLGYKVTFFDQFRPNLYSKILGTVKKLTYKNIESKINEVVNASLISATKKLSPDLVFIFKGRNITSETVQGIKRLGHMVINWYPDYYDDWEWIKNNASYYDHFFTPCLYIQKLLRKIHISSYYLPFAANADKTFIFTPKRYQATFVGRFTERREILFKQVYQTGLLDIWGYKHWQKTSYAPIYHGQLSPLKCIEVIRQSKITLNTLTATNDIPIESVNYRMFEATGVGGFVLSWYNYPLEEFFKLGKEVETYKTASEALEKTQYFLKHKSLREKIAYAGWKRTQKDHTYHKRLKKLFTYLK